MKPKRVVRQLQAVSLMLAGLLAATAFMAILSHYPGLVDMQLGANGGRVTIDNRPTRSLSR